MKQYQHGKVMSTTTSSFGHFPLLSQTSFRSTNYRTFNPGKTTYDSSSQNENSNPFNNNMNADLTSYKHKSFSTKHNNQHKPIKSEYDDLSEATTDDTLFALNEIKLVDDKIAKRNQNRQLIWKKKSNNNIYGTYATQNYKDIKAVKEKVYESGGWDAFNLKAEIERKKYFPIENVDIMFESARIMNDMKEKQLYSQQSYSNKYSSTKAVDLYTFSKQNRDICLKNILIQLLKNERNKISSKEQAVSQALIQAKEELGNDMEAFFNYQENQKLQFKEIETSLAKTVRENKLKIEEKRIISNEVRNTQNEIEKTIRSILLYKKYADFINGVMGNKSFITKMDLANIDLNSKDKDLDKTIAQIKLECGCLLEPDNSNKINKELENPELMTNLFFQLEANIIKYLGFKEDIEIENYVEYIKNSKHLKELANKEQEHINELHKLENEMITKKGVSLEGIAFYEGQINAYSGFIKELYEEICNKNINIRIKQPTDMIKEIFDALHKKETVLNTLIKDMEDAQGYKEEANALFRKLVDRKKNENKIMKYKEGVEKIKLLEEEKKLKYQQRMYRYKIHGPIVYPPPNVLNNKKRGNINKNKNKVNENEMLYYH